MIGSRIERLFSYPGRAAPRRNLETMFALDRWLGEPHRSFSSLHIAGTNGKGSVSIKIATALKAAGFRTGLYLSPHLSSWRERISINGEWIDEAFAEEFLKSLFSFVDREHLEPTFFELMTILCFAYFKEQGVEWAVLETGLGGRLDATNVVTPKLSVITSIDYDHMEQLGPTLDEIAQEKAGIIKPNVPLVIGPHADFAVMSRASSLIRVPGIKGFYDKENSLIAKTSLEQLGLPLYAIEKGVLARPPCRFELIDPAPILFDVAHNLAGFKRLNEALEEFYPGMLFKFVIAMGAKRDPKPCVDIIRSKASEIFCVSNGHERLREAKELAKEVRGKELSLEEALQEKGPLVVCGSFYIMEDARSFLLSHFVT